MVSEEDSWSSRSDFLQEVLVRGFEKRRFQTETINAMPLYPTETILWDENQIPNVHYTGKSTVPIPWAKTLGHSSVD